MSRAGYHTGLAAEALCRLALALKLYRVLAVRYKTPVGEIDIVAARGRCLIAVEVKARPTNEDAAAAIQPAQQARIARALQMFVQHHPRYAAYDLRFDAMMVVPGRWPRHIQNAWRV